MQKSLHCDNFKGEKPKTLTDGYVNAIERKLDEGYLVELFKLRDGTIIARSVKKKEITAAQ